MNEKDVGGRGRRGRNEERGEKRRGERDGKGERKKVNGEGRVGRREGIDHRDCVKCNTVFHRNFCIPSIF